MERIQSVLELGKEKRSGVILDCGSEKSLLLSGALRVRSQLEKDGRLNIVWSCGDSFVSQVDSAQETFLTRIGVADTDEGHAP
jgi:hypothetical protein